MARLILKRHQFTVLELCDFLPKWKHVQRRIKYWKKRKRDRRFDWHRLPNGRWERKPVVEIKLLGYVPLASTFQSRELVWRINLDVLKQFDEDSFPFPATTSRVLYRSFCGTNHYETGVERVGITDEKSASFSMITSNLLSIC